MHTFMAPFGVSVRVKFILASAFGTQELSQPVEDNGGDGCCTSTAPGKIRSTHKVGAAVTMTVEAGVIERCNGAVVELVPCEDSIKGKDAEPVTHGCCMALSELLLSPECLCYAATTAQDFDMKQILGLPAACKYNVKPHQACEGIPIPSYSKPPSEDLAPSASAEDLPPLGFSDEIRQEIKKEFRAHQARMDSQTPR